MNCDTLALAERLAKIMSCKDSAEFMYSPGTCKMLINKTKAVQLSRVMFGWDVMWVRMCDSFSPAVNIYQVQKVQKPFLKRNFQPKMPQAFHFLPFSGWSQIISQQSTWRGTEPLAMCTCCQTLGRYPLHKFCLANSVSKYVIRLECAMQSRHRNCDVLGWGSRSNFVSCTLAVIMLCIQHHFSIEDVLKA